MAGTTIQQNIEEVAVRLQDTGIQALAIHGRTRAQMYKGEADWRLIAAVKNNPRIHIPIFGNGDIDSPQKALEYKNRYGVDGIMIGRAAIGYPWIFNEIKHFLPPAKHCRRPLFSNVWKLSNNIFLNRWNGKAKCWVYWKCAGIIPII